MQPSYYHHSRVDPFPTIAHPKVNHCSYTKAFGDTFNDHLLLNDTFNHLDAVQLSFIK